MLWSTWLATATFGLLLTLLYILRPRRQVYFSAGFAALTWLLLAYQAPSVERLTDSGATVATPVPTPLAVLVGLLGLLSLTVLVLYRLNEYPPPQEGGATKA